MLSSFERNKFIMEETCGLRAFEVKCLVYSVGFLTLLTRSCELFLRLVWSSTIIENAKKNWDIIRTLEFLVALRVHDRSPFGKELAEQLG